MKDIALVSGDNELNVEMAPIVVAPPSGEILEIEWTLWGEPESWRPITDPMPAYDDVTNRFRIRNTGATVAPFKVGLYTYSSYTGWRWSYSPTVNINPGEGYVFWTFGTGKVEVITVTFHLFADDIEVDSMTVTVTKV
jgi:hypothetical protein